MKKIKQKIVVFAVFMLAITGAVAMQPALTASAATSCGGVTTSIISCDETGTGGDVEDSGVWGILLLTLNIMVAAVSVAALAGIVYGAVLYTSAGGNVEQTKKAMTIIGNVVIGLIAFALMYSLLNFLVPGGVFN